MLSARTAKLRTIGISVAALWLLLTVAWMIPPVQNWLISRVISPIITVPAMRQGFEAKVVLGDFYMRSKAGDYDGAHGLLSRDLQKSMSVEGLQEEWEKFSTKHGAIRNWHPPGRGNTISSGQINLWPKWVKFKHRIVGVNKSSGSATIRLSPEAGTWRIDQLTITP